MSEERFVVEGEVFLAVEAFAACYSIPRGEIERWVGEGLLGPMRRISGVPALPAVLLERVAALIRLTHLVGLDVAMLDALADLGELPGSGETVDPAES